MRCSKSSLCTGFWVRWRCDPSQSNVFIWLTGTSNAARVAGAGHAQDLVRVCAAFPTFLRCMEFLGRRGLRRLPDFREHKDCIAKMEDSWKRKKAGEAKPVSTFCCCWPLSLLGPPKHARKAWPFVTVGMTQSSKKARAVKHIGLQLTESSAPPKIL